MIKRLGLFTSALLIALLYSCGESKKIDVSLNKDVLSISAGKPVEFIYIWEIHSIQPLRFKPIVLKGNTDEVQVKIPDSTLAIIPAWEGRDSSLHFSPEDILILDSSARPLKGFMSLLTGDTSGFLNNYRHPHYFAHFLKVQELEDSVLKKIVMDSLKNSKDPILLYNLCYIATEILESDSIAGEVSRKLPEGVYRTLCDLNIALLKMDYARAESLSLKIKPPDIPLLHYFLPLDSIPQEWRFLSDYLRDLMNRDSIGIEEIENYRKMRNPISIRRDMAFFRFPGMLRWSSLKERLKKGESTDDYYMTILYMKAGDTVKAYRIVKKYTGKKEPSKLEPWWFELMMDVARDSSVRVEAMAYLAYFYGWPQYRETLETRFPKIADSLRKLILSRLPEAKPFKEITINGDTITLNELKGKIIVLNFWATWCGPCRREIPHLNELVEQFRNDTSIVFLAITKEDKRTVSKFLKKQPFDYTIIVNGKKATQDYGVRAFPTHFVINREGRIVFNQIGYSTDLKDKLKKVIENLRK